MTSSMDKLPANLKQAFLDLRNRFQEALNFLTLEDEQNFCEAIDFCGIKAHRLYQNLKANGFAIEYDKGLLKNRKEDSKCGPDELSFHLHIHAIEDLLNFIEYGTTDRKKIAKMKPKVS